METLTPAPPQPVAAAVSHRPWRTASLTGLSVWATMTVLHLAVSALARLPRRADEAGGLWSIALAWNGWDAGHYVRIAEEGYHIGPGFPAFFPLYPLLIRAFDVITPGGPLLAALLVANLAAWGALVMLHRLADHEFGPRVAQRATWYLAAFPMGFFLFIGYNESLFLLLALAALYAGRRGHWWLAGSLGALSSATRLFGVLLMVPLAVEYLRQIGWRPRALRPDVLGIALVPLGVVAYSVYCAIDLGSPLAFSIAQDQWGRQYTVPGGAWLTAIGQAGPGALDPATIGAVLDAGTTLAGVVLLALCVTGRFKFRRDQLYLVAQGAITLVMLMSTEVSGRSMQSAARYTMEAVAIFLVLARMGSHQLVDRMVLVVGVGLHAVFLVVFMSGTFLVA
ncbi:mannosyltransferase family protein [Actinoplanes xinjiangensis]|uniref:Mannosyltransferase PIG-V n=1 Tax=Actinoplanes xinjiangensis TaxID=512350 RepID=A0A316FGZ4_9ACTN|nr:mannosyltransferase family protein [Actinoplanes xinjiangensis]PWK48221.1 mannosyltransferase PIG-V [Actinoplanes xinjiangensis]GIF39024.1 membrane protein [Actinoplanes xinjiangensis]